MNKFKYYLDGKGIKQKWLSEQTGISKNSINKMYQGGDYLVSNLILICRALECSPYDIVDFGDEPNY